MEFWRRFKELYGNKRAFFRFLVVLGVIYGVLEGLFSLAEYLPELSYYGVLLLVAGLVLMNIRWCAIKIGEFIWN